MAKITNIEDKTYQGQVTGHVITLDNGTTGYLADKVSDVVKEGDNVDCQLEVKKNKQGGNYNLLTLKIVQAGAPSSQATTPSQVLPPTRPISGMYSERTKGIAEMKHEARIAVIEVLGRLASEGKIEPKSITEYFNEFYPAVDLSYDCIA